MWSDPPQAESLTLGTASMNVWWLRLKLGICSMRFLHVGDAEDMVETDELHHIHHVFDIFGFLPASGEPVKPETLCFCQIYIPNDSRSWLTILSAIMRMKCKKIHGTFIYWEHSLCWPCVSQGNRRQTECSSHCPSTPGSHCVCSYSQCTPTNVQNIVCLIIIDFKNTLQTFYCSFQ